MFKFLFNEICATHNNAASAETGGAARTNGEEASLMADAPFVPA